MFADDDDDGDVVALINNYNSENREKYKNLETGRQTNRKRWKVCTDRGKVHWYNCLVNRFIPVFFNMITLQGMFTSSQFLCKQ